ncbi:MAG TPA: GNAT family N-acetyltransferase [Geminicoccaceae bacterium]|nr:GNAT family N-acetyltransferase [Geminicoccaceae bacterium]
MRFHRLAPDEVDWEALDAFEDRVFSQRRHWLRFIQSFVNGDIVVAELRDVGRTLGYFTGIRSRVCGVPVLGSPFRGWLTAEMGFNLAPGVPRYEALRALEDLAFRQLGCLQLEVGDRGFRMTEEAGPGFRFRDRPTYVSDLTLSEDELLARMSRSCRWNIRKAEKNGLRAEVAEPDGFAEEFYGHLCEVFAKQGLVPPYGIERVRALIEHVHPSGDLLLARVRHPNGTSIASGIYPGFGKMSFFWAAGSLREYQVLRSSEILHWFAMRHWKARGVEVHDWAGANRYKERYGATIQVTPILRKSRFQVLEHARETMIKLRNLPRRLQRRRYDKKIGAGYA